MRSDRNRATTLRMMGKSYREISRELGVPVSTLSDWFKGEIWSVSVKDKLNKLNFSAAKVRMEHLNTIRGGKLAKHYETAEKEAREEFELLKYHPLFIAGLMIYAGEGEKTTKHQVRIANINPRLISIFKLFITEICKVPEEKIRAWLLLYPDLLEERCINYWIVEGKLGGVQFHKTMVIKGKSEVKRVHYGVCNVVISSSYLKRKMIVWLELIEKELANFEYYAGIV